MAEKCHDNNCKSDRKQMHGILGEIKDLLKGNTCLEILAVALQLTTQSLSLKCFQISLILTSRWSKAWL